MTAGFSDDLTTFLHVCVQSEVAFEYFGDKFSVEANDAVKAGAQLYITYGRQGNDRLLQFYGFSEADNPNDTYVIRDMKTAVEVTLEAYVTCSV